MAMGNGTVGAGAAGGGGDLIDALLRDHRETKGLLEEFPTLELDQRLVAFPYIVRALVGHETAEELVVYPALRAAAAGGAGIANDRLEEQHRAERLLADLERTRLDDRSFEASFRSLEQYVLDHAEREEQSVFPVLAAHLGDAERRRLAAHYQRAKRQAPTHPHPASPHLPPVVRTAGVLDRVRDTVTLRNAPRLRRALRQRDPAALLQRPPWRPGHG
jgi:hemerythrin superfamily protein